MHDDEKDVPAEEPAWKDPRLPENQPEPEPEPEPEPWVDPRLPENAEPADEPTGDETT